MTGHTPYSALIHEYDAELMYLVDIPHPDIDDGGGGIANANAVESDDRKRNVLFAFSWNRHPELDDGTRFNTATQEKGRVRIVRAPDAKRGIGQLLKFYENEGVPEAQALNLMKNPIEFNDFHDHLKDWSNRERRLELIDQLDYLVDTDPRYKKTQELGEFRTIERLDSSQNELLRGMLSDRPKTGVCYEEVMKTLNGFTHHDEVQYVEGAALSKYGGCISAHAWLEIDGAVIDPTWIWHGPRPPDDAVYFGVEFDPVEAKETMNERGRYTSVLFSDEEFQDVFENLSGWTL